MRPLQPLTGHHFDLDHNATAPLHPLARAAMAEVLDLDPGNPSSIHGRGQAGRALVERARRQLAQALAVAPAELALTSGATESNVLAWRGVLEPMLAAGRRPTVVTTVVEHPSIRALAAAYRQRGVDVREIAVDDQGRWDLEPLPALLCAPALALVSVMLVNNETGIVHPVQQVALAARSLGAVVHSDATQAVGRIPLDIATLGVDLLSLSGHKFGGPKGTGALWLRSGVPITAVAPGHQELAVRAGTENVIGVVGMGAAATALPNRLGQAPTVRATRDALWPLLAQLGADRNAMVAPEDETGHVLNLSFHGVAAPVLVMALDLAGVLASAGSACASGTLEPSHVQLAMHSDRGEGLQRAKAALRLSLGPDCDLNRVADIAAIFGRVLARLRSHLPAEVPGATQAQSGP